MINPNRTFGIEIEAFGVDSYLLAQTLTNAGVETVFEGYNHTRRDHWKIVRDASIQGNDSFELVSPPLKGQEGLDQIQTVCQVLNQLGAQVNKSCGLHVHHSAADMDLTSFKNLYSLYIRFETTLDQLVPQSRRGSNNEYCRSLTRSWTTINQSTSVDEIRRGLGSRYLKLNIESLWRHNTIEFRHHAGTTNASKIINWVILTQLMVERSKSRVAVTSNRIGDTNLKQLQKVLTRNLQNTHSNLFTYFRNRINSLQSEAA